MRSHHILQIMIHTEGQSRVQNLNVGEDGAPDLSNGQIVSQSKQLNIMKFTNLLMTFSFDFKSVEELAIFAGYLLQSMENKIRSGYFHDYVYLDQLSIKQDNNILINDLNESADLSQYLKAPETYTETTEIHQDGPQKTKKLIYSLGIVLIEIIAQRYIAIVPPKMKAQDYSMFIHRRQKLNQFIELVVQCMFMHYIPNGRFTLQSNSLYLNETVLHLITILQQMTNEDPNQRPNLQECKFYFEMLCSSYHKKKLKIQSANLEKCITQIAKQDKKALIVIIKNLVQCIKLEDHEVTSSFKDQILNIKELFTQGDLTNVIYEILELLKGSYIKEHDYKYFAYLQQFYIKLLFQQRLFVTDNMQMFADYKIDQEEYFHATNVIAYCHNLELFKHKDVSFQLIRK